MSWETTADTFSFKTTNVNLMVLAEKQKQRDLLFVCECLYIL